MKNYLCNRLDYSGKIDDAKTFEASDDDKARELAAEFAAEGIWLDYEVWQDQRLIKCNRRAHHMGGVLADLADCE